MKARATRRLIAITAAAVMLLALVASTAAARNISTSNQNVRVTWSSLEFGGGGKTVRCRITLEGSFHTRTIAKVRDLLIGSVTRAIVHHPCTNGEAWDENGVERAPLGTLANTLPWHISYQGFTGTLPNITNLDLIVSRFRILIEAEFFFIRCRARYGSAEDRITGRAPREAGGAITNLVPLAGSNNLTKIEDLGGTACPAIGTFLAPATDGRVTLLNSNNRITITLI